MVQLTDLKTNSSHSTEIDVDKEVENNIIDLLVTLNDLCQKLVENQRTIILMQAQTHNQLVLMCLDEMQDSSMGHC